MWSVVRTAAARQLRVSRVVKQAGSQRFIFPSAYRLALFKRNFTETGSEQATTSVATEAKPKVTKTATTTKKPAAKKSKAATTKSVAAKAKKPKKKKKAVKAAPKKRVRKVLSPEAKRAAEIRQLKKIALLDPPKSLPARSWMVFISQYYKDYQGGQGGIREIVPQIAQAYKELPASEMERLSTIASQNQAANVAAYRAWIQSKTPIEIDAANRARKRLKHLLAPTLSTYCLGRRFAPIKDERQPTKPRSGFTLFCSERWQSGDLDGVSVPEAGSRISAEWKALTDAERKSYDDRALPERQRYIDETRRILDRDTFVRSLSPDA